MRKVLLCGLAFLASETQAQTHPVAAFDRQGQIIESQQRDRLREDQERALRALPPPGGAHLDTVKPQVQGLALLGALHDPAGLPGDLPHAQSGKFTLELGYNRRLSLDSLGGTALTLSTQFSGQRAVDTLYGTQQFLIGGPSSVRGFQNCSLAGDHGYFVRNELGLPWRLPADAFVALAGRVYAGFDWGTVTNRAPGVPSGALSGATLGVGVFWKNVSLDAFASRAVHAPSPQLREGTLLSLRLSASI